MPLSLRFTLATTSLVLLTAATIGWLAERNLELVAIPAALTRLHSDTRLASRQLDELATAAKSDVQFLARVPAVQALVRARMAGLPSAVVTERDEAVARVFLSALEAKTDYLQLRVIGRADGGREIVRVDRSGSDGALRIVARDGLQRKGDRPYVQVALASAPGVVSLSTIDLNREHGAVEVPHVPVMRASTPIADDDGAVFGIIAINVDCRGTLAALRALGGGGRTIYVTSDDGSYLLHPDREREFGADLGRPTRWQDDFAAFLRAPPMPHSGVLVAEPGRPRIAVDLERLAQLPDVAVVQALSEAALAGPVDNVLRSMLTVGGIAVLSAMLLGAALARSLTRPLGELTARVKSFGAGGGIPAPVVASGEVGELSRAFATMAEEIEGKTAALTLEIAERERAEASLALQHAKERHYLAVVESTSEAIVATGLDGTITAWNPAADRLYGWSASEMIGRPLVSLVPDERREELAALMDRVRTGERVERLETKRSARSGTIDVSLSVSPICASSGAVVGISEISHDVAALKLAERRLRNVVEACPAGMCVVRSDGRIRLVNGAIETLFGYSREELLGRPVETLIPARFRSPHAGYRALFAAAPRARPMGAGRDLFAQRRDGSEIAIEIGLSPFGAVDEGDVLCSIVDVTERRHAHERLAEYAESLERSNADLEEFAYVVSHDLRAPLRGIAMVAEWLDRDFSPLVDDDARENIALMRERTGRLDRLISGILDYSRVARQTPTLTLVDADGLVRDVIASMARTPGVTIAIDGALPAVAYDETQLRQIFQNLIDNAVKHLGKPTGSVVVSCVATEAVWTFRVSDDGVGIPERHRERIFGLFQTLRPKDQTGTTGAGLAIVKRTVERNGGTIGVRSSVSGGAEFWFTVLRREVEADRPARMGGVRG